MFADMSNTLSVEANSHDGNVAEDSSRDSCSLQSCMCVLHLTDHQDFAKVEVEVGKVRCVHRWVVMRGISTYQPVSRVSLSLFCNQSPPDSQRGNST